MESWPKAVAETSANAPRCLTNDGCECRCFHDGTSLNRATGSWNSLSPLDSAHRIVGASNAFNMIAGFNGLEAGMGIIILFSMGTAAYLLGKPWVGVLALLMTASLLAFLIYNKYPAKVFPGDTLTYSVGAFIACIAILGNMERLAVLLYTLYYLDFALSLRGRFKVEAFGVPDEKGCLKEPRQKLYHLTHLAIRLIRLIKGCAREYEVVVLIWAVQVLISILALLHYLLY